MLGPLEEEVVAALQVLERSNTRQILELLRERGVDVAYNTVGTILARLYEKGIVDRTTERYERGERYVYLYKDIKKEYVDNMLQGMVKLFGPKGVVYLVERLEGISEEELKEIKRKLRIR